MYCFGARGATTVTCTHKVTDRLFSVQVQVWPISTNKGSLSYWCDVESYFIGNWVSTPKVYIEKINPAASFYFLEGCAEAIQAWNSALEINMTETSQPSTADIHVNGGNDEELNELGYHLPSNALGGTWPECFYSGYYLYGSSVKLAAEMTGAVICIKYCQEKTMDEDIQTCVHEFGHALGFLGHTASPLTVMYPYGHSEYELQASEKNHLKQVYD